MLKMILSGCLVRVLMFAVIAGLFVLALLNIDTVMVWVDKVAALFGGE